MRIGIVLVEFPPDHDGSLLQHLVRIMRGGQQRPNETPKIGLVVSEERDKSLVALIFVQTIFAGWFGGRIHGLSR